MIAAPTSPRATTAVVSSLQEVGDLATFAGRTVTALPRTPRYAAEVLHQAARMISGTAPLLLVMNMFFGFTIVNFAYFFLRAIGAADYTGLATGLGVPRLGAVVMFSYVFTAKVCCGIVAELGAAKISEELDAYEAEGMDPYRYVFGTRVLAVLIFLPIGAAVSLFGGSLGSYVNVVVILQGLSAESFLHVHWSIMNVQDQLYSFVSMTSVAVVGVIVACFYGSRASGGPAGVGVAVARSLVVNLTLVHLIASFFVITFYGGDAKLPIGG